ITMDSYLDAPRFYRYIVKIDKKWPWNFKHAERVAPLREKFVRQSLTFSSLSRGIKSGWAALNKDSETRCPPPIDRFSVLDFNEEDFALFGKATPLRFTFWRRLIR